MADADITLEVLRDIRDSIRTLDKNVGSRIDATNERIDETNARVTALTIGVTLRLDAIDRTIAELATQMFMLGRYVKNRSQRRSTI